MAVLVTSVFGFEHMFDPIAMTSLSSWLGFRLQQDAMCLFYLSYFLLYFVFTYKDRQAQKREELRESYSSVLAEEGSELF